MNIFLPYEDNLVESVKALDDLRLNKQILEVYQLLTNAINEYYGIEIKGYKNHPLYVFYKENRSFLCYYGIRCCFEYEYRFDKEHRLKNKFRTKQIIYDFKYNPPYTPYYMEGSKGQPNYIRTTENVSELFQQKLIKKWENDKAKGRPPKWTNRDVPQFYQDFMKGE